MANTITIRSTAPMIMAMVGSTPRNVRSCSTIRSVRVSVWVLGACGSGAFCICDCGAAGVASGAGFAGSDGAGVAAGAEGVAGAAGGCALVSSVMPPIRIRVKQSPIVQFRLMKDPPCPQGWGNEDASGDGRRDAHLRLCAGAVRHFRPGKGYPSHDMMR